MEKQLVVVPNFIDEDQIKYIIGLTQESSTEFYEKENRHRFIVDWNQNPIFHELAVKVCRQFNTDLESLEYGAQVFIHNESGQTYYHTDALNQANGKRRYCTALLYLNDDYLGSYLDFPYLGTRIKPQKGMMIAYPIVDETGEMNTVFGHSASIITKGIKYMCVFTLIESIA